jgi:hypothetical protein
MIGHEDLGSFFVTFDVRDVVKAVSRLGESKREE